jgi:hypothetical protein
VSKLCFIVLAKPDVRMASHLRYLVEQCAPPCSERSEDRLPPTTASTSPAVRHLMTPRGGPWTTVSPGG